MTRLAFLKVPVFAFALAFTQGVPASAQDSGQEDIYAPARDIVGEIGEVVTPNGVQEALAIEIGGVKQFINVRGADRDNPIMLFVHGGPGSTEMPIAWTFQRHWEDYFTVVQWDQRGAGKTYRLNDPAEVAPTLNLERYRADTVELINYLRDRYDKDKIFLMGHSFGSVVSLGVAEQHPELLHAYIGVGQVIDFRDNETVGYQWVLDQARADGNDEAVAELESIAPYPGDGPLDIEKTNLQRKWSIYYGALAGNRRNADFYYHAARLAPTHGPEDRKAMNDGSAFTIKHMWPQLTDVSLKGIDRIGVPVFMFMGRDDYTSPPEIVSAWLEKLDAPEKELVWFEQSAHLPMITQPGRFFAALLTEVRPVATEDAN